MEFNGMELSDLVAVMAQQGASNLYLSPANPPVLRIEGELVAHGSRALGDAGVRSLLSSLVMPDQWDGLVSSGSLSIMGDGLEGEIFLDDGAAAAALHRKVSPPAI